jgi:SNF2 family DNA or RNA helicase
MGGYADDLFNIFYRTNAKPMVKEGYECSEAGKMDFLRKYGVVETVEKIKDEEHNACSKAKKTSSMVYRRPGASPLLFGRHLMQSTVFLSLDDISNELPPYKEEVLEIPLEGRLESSYTKLEDAFRDALRHNPKHKGLRSLMLQTLLCYPDHPFGWETLTYKVLNMKTFEVELRSVGKPANLPETTLFPKEKHLIENIREELAEGRRCQVFATFTHSHDVLARLERVLRDAGFRVAVMRSTVPTDKREDWYEKRLREGVEVVVCHPKLVETGLDLISFPSIYFYETGYSLHTLRQASRRSWRIGQRKDVRIKFFTYKDTVQTSCVRLMGKKMLVAMMTEGKFSGEGLQSFNEDDDLVSAMVRELVEKNHVGETADKVWKDLDRERTKYMPARTSEDESASKPAGPVLVYSNPKPPQKEDPEVLWAPPSAMAGVQMSLFG